MKIQDLSLVLMSIAVGAPAAVLIPFVGWIFGWYGAAVVIIALGFAPAYVFGTWLGDKTSKKWTWYFCGFGSAAISLAFALWLVPHNVFDPAVWAWFATAFVMWATVYAAAGRHDPVPTTWPWSRGLHR